MNIVVRHLSIRGRVQGVGYRWSMTREAERLGVAGWVRNRRDGSVEATVHGNATAVEAIITWAQRGPAGAQVIGVEINTAEGEFDGFEQWPTA